MNDEIKHIDTILEQWQTSTINYLPKVFLAIIVFTIFYLFANFVKKFSIRFYKKFFTKKPEAINFVSSIIHFLFLLMGAFLALEVLGLESVLSKLLAGAGIVGIVAGFAFKDIASNVFAGFLLHLQRPFKEEDWVTIDNTFGTILEIGWITTSIKTIAGQEVFVPNQLIYNNTFTNFSTFGKRRVIFKSGVSYGDDLDLVKKCALEEVNKVNSVLKNDVIDFYFTDIGSSAYNFEVRFWVKFTHQKDYLSAMNEIIIRIKKRFEEENISLAYNVTTLDFGVKGGVNIFDKPIQTK